MCIRDSPIVGENGIVYFVKSDRKAVYAVSVNGYLWNTSLPTYQLFGTKYEQATACLLYTSRCV